LTDNGLLDVPPKTCDKRNAVSNCAFRRTQTSPRRENTVDRWEKIRANHSSNKGQILRIHKELLQLNKEPNIKMDKVFEPTLLQSCQCAQEKLTPWGSDRNGTTHKTK
jgi:hypothetical protein